MTTPAFELALSELQKVQDPINKICTSSAYWIPLQWLYVEMAKNKDLVRLSELPIEKKEQLWNIVKGFDWPRWKKVNIAQAIYVYEYLK